MKNIRIYNIFSHFWLLPYLALIMVSCTAPPSGEREIAPWRGTSWTPPRYIAVPALPTGPVEEEVDAEFDKHEGPWQVIEMVDVALKNNPATMQSWENAKANAYLWRASHSTLYPTVSLDEQLLLQRVGGSEVGAIDSEIGDNTTAAAASSAAARLSKAMANNSTQIRALTRTSAIYNYNQWMISTLSFTYLMWDFGGRLANIEAAKQALFAANWSHNRNIQTVILNVLLDYYQHLQARALYKARIDDLKNAEENLASAEGQFQMGVAKKVDVLLARSNVANAKLLLQEQDGLIQITMGQLANAMGLSADRIFDVAPLPEDIAYDQVKENIDELIAIAKVERPDLAAAEAVYKNQKEQAAIIWSEGMPTLVASGYVQQNTNIHHPVFNDSVSSGTISLNIPLFNGFFYVNQTRAANANAAAAYAAWKAQEENVILDVVSSYYHFTTAVETVKFSQEYYNYTEEAYQIAFESYRAGVGTFIDLLAAQSALSNARAQRIIAKTQWITALTNIAYATGSL